MFGGKKKLYADGAQTEGVVVAGPYFGEHRWDAWYKVRVKFPDGSTKDIETGRLLVGDVGELWKGLVVPIRYNSTDVSKTTIDLPALKARHQAFLAAQQAELDVQVAHLGEPNAPSGVAGLGDLGDLQAGLMQMMADKSATVIDLRGSGEPHPSNPADQLIKLAALHEKGILSDAEFAAVKAKMLGL